MPYKTYNAFNAQGTPAAYSDMEKVDIQRGLTNADTAFKQAMLNMQGRQLDQQGAQFNAGLGAQERMQANALASQRDLTGTFGDRTAAQKDLLGVQMGGQERIARIGQEVPLAALGFQNQMYQDTRNDGASARDLAALRDRAILGVLTQAGVGGSAAAGSGTIDPKLQSGIIRSFFDLGEDPDQAFTRDLQQSITEQTAKGLASTDPRVRAASAAALRERGLNVPAGGIPTAPMEVTPPEALAGDLVSGAERFAQADAATIGWDPTAQDVELLGKQRDDYAAALEARGATREAAIAEANRLIEQKLAPFAGKMGTGWIKALRQRLGVLAGG